MPCWVSVSREGPRKLLRQPPPPSTSTHHSLVTPSPCSSLGADAAHVGHPAWLQTARWGLCPVVFRMEKKPGGYKVLRSVRPATPVPWLRAQPRHSSSFPLCRRPWLSCPAHPCLPPFPSSPACLAFLSSHLTVSQSVLVFNQLII